MARAQGPSAGVVAWAALFAAACSVAHADPPRSGDASVDAAGGALEHLAVAARVQGTLDAHDRRVHPSSPGDLRVEDSYVVDVPDALLPRGVTIVVSSGSARGVELELESGSGPLGWSCARVDHSVVVFTPVVRGRFVLHVRTRGRSGPGAGVEAYTVETFANVDLDAIHRAGCRWYGEAQR